MKYDDMSNEELQLLLFERCPETARFMPLVTDENRQTVIGFLILCEKDAKK